MHEELEKLKKARWEISLYHHPGLAYSQKSDHFKIYDATLESDIPDFTPYFASPHVDVLPENQVDRAHIRIQCILRLVSGLRVICGRKKIVLVDRDITLIKERSFPKMIGQENIDILIEELENPFNDEVSNVLCDSNTSEYGFEEQDFFNIIVKDSSVREVITLFALGEEQVLYFLINAYKILEIIRDEYKLQRKGETIVKKAESKPIPDYLLEPLKTFQGFAHYINTKDGSGIFSRHGSKGSFPNHKKPSHAKMREVLILVIKAWLNHKCEILYNRSYISQSENTLN